MTGRHALPALTAGAATGLVLMLRWAASRSRRPRSDAEAVLREAERHVYRYWKRLRTQLPPRDAEDF